MYLYYVGEAYKINKVKNEKSFKTDYARHSKGKGKGIRARDHARGRRLGLGLHHALSRAQIPPSPSPSPYNAGHAGYTNTYE